MLSTTELFRIIVDPEVGNAVAQTFSDNSTRLLALRYFYHISYTIDNLERLIESQRQEQEALFKNFMTTENFLMQIEPLVQRFREEGRRLHLHPHRTPLSREVTVSPIEGHHPPSTATERKPNRPCHSVHQLQEPSKDEDADTDPEESPFHIVTQNNDIFRPPFLYEDRRQLRERFRSTQ